MNKAISIIRIAVLLGLSLFAFLFLFGEEQDESTLAFFIHFTVDKGLAIGAAYLTARLYFHWSKVDPWIAAYDRWSDNGEDNPNPMYLGNDKED